MDRSLLILSDVTFKMAAWWPSCFFRFPDSNFSLALNIKSKLQCHFTCVHGKEPIDFQQCHCQNACQAAILDFVVSGLYRWHGFQGVNQVCFVILISNFICMLFVVMGRSLLVYSYVNKSKWPPGGHLRFFSFGTLTLVWLWISSANFNATSLVCMGRSLLFSVKSLPKWPPGGDIGFFCLWTLTLVWH